eukprot:CAMPEP_0182574436 /NCGR_PEP_ID=MMETSP1324-20130603/25091_1 /TAXON_ID=236786 /ORGANISM="Florenciella sp., Strain RCC1587" /LENGTH=146 /DNA_ID=CAMNT_0024789797 /DNA_START=43 /DNA_END=483 /DNA_ORIENTATION=-
MSFARPHTPPQPIPSPTAWRSADTSSHESYYQTYSTNSHDEDAFAEECYYESRSWAMFEQLQRNRQGTREVNMPPFPSDDDHMLRPVMRPVVNASHEDDGVFECEDLDDGAREQPADHYHMKVAARAPTSMPFIVMPKPCLPYQLH